MPVLIDLLWLVGGLVALYFGAEWLVGGASSLAVRFGISPLVVGLTTAPERLVQIRRNRLLSLNEGTETSYVDNERVKTETQFARRMFADNGWPVIDVTRRSIEESAAAIIRLVQERKRNDGQNDLMSKPI